jgi:hypothetical protein
VVRRGARAAGDADDGRKIDLEPAAVALGNLGRLAEYEGRYAAAFTSYRQAAEVLTRSTTSADWPVRLGEAETWLELDTAGGAGPGRCRGHLEGQSSNAPSSSLRAVALARGGDRRRAGAIQRPARSGARQPHGDRQARSRRASWKSSPDRGNRREALRRALDARARSRWLELQARGRSPAPTRAQRRGGEPRAMSRRGGPLRPLLRSLGPRRSPALASGGDAAGRPERERARPSCGAWWPG